jgi:hypothetical protein
LGDFQDGSGDLERDVAYLLFHRQSGGHRKGALRMTAHLDLRKASLLSTEIADWMDAGYLVAEQNIRRPEVRIRFLFLLVCLAVAATVLAVGCSQLKSGLGIAPRPEVVASDAFGRPNGQDYGVTVVCQIRNNGKDGEVVVFAELESDSASWRKEQTVSIREGSTITLQFSFPEAETPEQALDGYRYRVWAKAR